MRTILEKLKSWGRNQNSHAVRSALMFLPVFLFAGTLIVGITILALQLLGRMPEPKTYSWQNLAGVLVLFSAVIMATLVAASIWAKWLGFQGLEFIGWNKKYRKLFIGILWGIGLQLFIFIFLIVLGWLQITKINLESEAVVNVLIITVSSINIAIFEEVLWRGVLYSTLRQRWNWWTTAIILSIPFSLYHFISNSYDFPIIAGFALFIGGFLFTWIREISGDLWIPIGIHFVWDAAVGWFNLYASKTPHVLMTAFNAPKWAVGDWSVSDWILIFAFALSIWIYRLRQKAG